MPKGIVGTARVDKATQLRERAARLEAQLKQTNQQYRFQSKRDYTNRCVEIGKVVEACSLFETDLGELETLLKAGKRAVKEKRGESGDV